MVTSRTPKLSLAAASIVISLSILLTYDCLAMFVYLLRVAGFPDVGQAYAYINALVLALLAAVAVVSTGRTLVTGRGAAPGLFYWALAMILLHIYGLGSAVVNHQPLQRAFVGQIYYWWVMFLGFCVGYGSRIDAAATRRLESLVGVFSYAILICNVIGLVALEAFRRATSTAVYAGYPASTLLLPALYFAHRRRWGWVLAALALIVITAKRGPLLALLVALAYLAVRDSMPRKIAVVVLAIAALPLVGPALDYFTQQPVEVPQSAAARVAAKWARTVSGLRAGEFRDATAGRNIEIEQALELLRTPRELWLGHGYGWTVSLDPDSAERKHFVHLSYLNTLVTYGLVGAVPFCAAFGWSLWRVLRARRTDTLLLAVFGLLTLAMAVMSVSVNQLGVSIVFWMVAGISLRLARPAEAATETHRYESPDRRRNADLLKLEISAS